MSTKPDCYECAHRRDLINNAHSQCVHPDTFKEMPHFMAKVAGSRRAYTDGAQPLHIDAVPHGLTSGWFAWPLNFDPVWLLNCDGHTPLKARGEQ